MKSDDRNPRLVVAAALAAAFAVFVFGLAYRVLAVRVGSPPDRTPIDAATVERISLQIGDWTGRDVPLDETTRRATGSDAQISRLYTRPSSASVSLYVACGVNARALMPHRPEVCYIAAGFTLMDHYSLELALDDRRKLPCSVFQFSRGGLDAERRTVLYYYIVDGQYCGDISLLRSRAWRGSNTVDYVTQVQIVASTGTLTAEAATKMVSAFAVDSASAVAQVFEDTAAGWDSGKCRESLQGQ